MRRKKLGFFGKTGFLDTVNRNRPRGMTLMELLIVVAVMVILLGAALPLLKIGLAGRRTREASRQLNTYAALAKSRAIELGRPAGLFIDTQWLMDDPTNPVPYASELFLAETPRPYAGDMVDARAWVRPDSSANRFEITFSDSASLTTTLPTALVQGGESFQIKFDYKGPLYECQRDPNNNDFVITLDPAFLAKFVKPGSDGVWGTANGGTNNDGDDNDDGNVNDPFEALWVNSDDIILRFPYQIFRQPQKSSATPMELPRGAVIDLSNSGFGLGKRFLRDDPAITSTLLPGTYELVSGPIIIQFGRTGSVPRIDGLTQLVVWTDANNQRHENRSPLPPPTATIHLLLGEIEDIGPVNLQNPDNLWVSIGHQAGKVTSTENGWTPTNATLASAREFAQSAQSIRGR